VFHTAARESRGSIKLEGLRASQPGGEASGSPWPDPYGVWASQPAGVYVAERPDVNGKWSRWASWDVWRVDASELGWRPDPLNPRCWVLGDVGPERLVLHGIDGV
jgi:hypothetical protein